MIVRAREVTGVCNQTKTGDGGGGGGAREGGRERGSCALEGSHIYIYISHRAIIQK